MMYNESGHEVPEISDINQKQYKELLQMSRPQRRKYYEYLFKSNWARKNSEVFANKTIHLIS